MPELAMRKMRAGDLHPNSYVLAPVDQFGAEDFGKVPHSETLHATLRSSVNMGKWRLFQALAAKVAEAHPHISDREEAMDAICYGVKHIRTAFNPKTGNAIISRKSTSPHAFDSGGEFDRFFDRAQYYVLTQLLPGVPAGVLRDEIEKIVAPNIGGRR